MILLIDNYDSFTYNLYQCIEEMGHTCKVIRNDEMTVEQIEKLNPTHIVLSPGPGRPEAAGVTLEVIARLSGRFPILGICLGHQAIAMAFGGQVVFAPTARHGKHSSLSHKNLGLFRDLPQDLKVVRYHSLMVNDLPNCLEITSMSDDGVVMGLKHKEFNIEGLQFHPESYATESGVRMLQNFFKKVS